ncbi:MAG: hypothetical protein L0Y71_17360 [Gemmataceae bacterium]|nr:hypothetical protein [Gemmataceae bacterium]
MVGSWRDAVTACLAVVLSASSADALGGRAASRPAYRAAAYSAPAVWCYWVALPPCWGHVPAPPPSPRPRIMPLAMPLPAPASTSTTPNLPAPGSTTPRSTAPTANEPPLSPKRAPTITESRSYGGVTRAGATDAPAGRCKVGFWNITGGDVTLTIDGRTRRLPKDRALDVQLPRTFVWQIDGRAAQTETIPEGQNMFEVILRPER